VIRRHEDPEHGFTVHQFLADVTSKLPRVAPAIRQFRRSVGISDMVIPTIAAAKAVGKPVKLI
jgi:hypothetical protein